ncbi:MAG: exo-alpha-sialidase, partial [Planctomycetota bacterium]
GLYDMHGNVEEWCYDWYGPYQDRMQRDPVGRISGDFRVTRGGSAGTKPFYLRTANRMGMTPEDKHWLTGFRVVLGRFPGTKPLPSPAVERFQENVIIREASEIVKGPDPDKPWFKGPRKYVTIPKEAIGPLYAGHNHDPAIVECPNGDLLTVWYTCFSEKDRELNQGVSRLRWGSEEWEPASLFWDAPDRNDHAPALWFDGDQTLYHFLSVSAGPTYHDGALTMRTSKDSGASWTRPRFIVSEHSGLMPSEAVFRMNDGAIALTVDGPKTVWVSRDEGLSWENLPGDMPGIHVGATQLADGQIIGFTRGGSVKGKMSKSVSVDGGKTYTNTASEFPPIGGGQRLVLLRLKEGALFFASFATKPVYVINSSGKKHKIRGLFAAVSLDGGKSWPYKRLISDNKKPRMVECTDGRVVIMSDYKGEFEGYLSVCQSQNGLIHLISSREHYAFNLKWMTTRPPVPKEPLRIRRFVDNFTGPRKLSVRGWADYKSFRGSFNGSGQYTVDATPHGGVNRIVGEGSFEAKFTVGNIRSNSGLAGPRVNVGFRDAFRETFYVQVKPDLIKIVLPESMPKVKAVSFPENISSVTVKFTWDEYDNRLRVFYGLNNAEPEVEFDESRAGLFIDRGMSESTSAFMYVRNGIADLDHFEIVPIKY